MQQVLNALGTIDALGVLGATPVDANEVILISFY